MQYDKWLHARPNLKDVLKLAPKANCLESKSQTRTRLQNAPLQIRIFNNPKTQPKPSSTAARKPTSHTAAPTSQQAIQLTAIQPANQLSSLAAPASQQASEPARRQLESSCQNIGLQVSNARQKSRSEKLPISSFTNLRVTLWFNGLLVMLHKSTIPQRHRENGKFWGCDVFLVWATIFPGLGHDFVMV